MFIIIMIILMYIYVCLNYFINEKFKNNVHGNVVCKFFIETFKKFNKQISHTQVCLIAIGIMYCDLYGKHIK